MPKSKDYYAIVKTNQKFWALFQSARKQFPTNYLDHRIIALDPGETTGWSAYYPLNRGPEHIQLSLRQLETKTVERGVEILDRMLGQAAHEFPNRTLLVCEDYKVYGWKSDDHKWASLHTPQLIGAIRCIAYQRKIPIVTQMAQVAKKFATDENLEQWGVYERGMKHARDAERHLLHAMVFGTQPQKPS
jgi:hypothetical protein